MPPAHMSLFSFFTSHSKTASKVESLTGGDGPRNSNTTSPIPMAGFTNTFAAPKVIRYSQPFRTVAKSKSESQDIDTNTNTNTDTDGDSNISSAQTKRPAVLTIGSALVDIFISSDQFEISHGDEEVFTTRSRGGKLTVDSFKIKTGGGGGNTAAGFATAGFDVSCVAELGVDELAEIVVGDLRKHGVKTTHLVQERKEETGGSVLLVSDGGERTALVHRGAAALLDPHDIDEHLLSKQDWIHLSSVAGRTHTIQEVFRIAHQHAVPVSWNPGQSELEELAKMADNSAALQEYVNHYGRGSHPVKVLLLNKQEWQLVEAIQSALRAVVQTIVVTDSVRGGVVYEGNSEQEYQAIPVKSVDNTGAGDAFAVGFVSAIVLKKPVSTAVQWGVRNAAAVVQQPGAKHGLLSLQDLEQNE
jgi:ribokinase